MSNSPFGLVTAVAVALQGQPDISPAEQFDAQFKPLAAIVYDESARFSGSGMSASLEALEPAARAAGDESLQMANLQWLEAVVFDKRGLYDQAYERGDRALALHEKLGALDVDTRVNRHHRLSKIAEDSEDVGDEDALSHMQAAVQLSEDSACTLNVDQKLGMRQHVGYLLHETGAFREAMAHNQALLVDAVAAFGTADDARLLGLLNNLAQNAYELGQADLALQHLRTRLATARAVGRLDAVLDSLFQMGVLAHEAGASEQARSYFDQRVQLARESGDTDLLRQALATLAEFEQRERNREH